MSQPTEPKRILLASFPHSGSNWLAYIIMNAFNIEVKGATERYSVKAIKLGDEPFREGITVFKSHLHCFDEPNPKSYDGMIFCSRNAISAIRSYAREQKDLNWLDYSQGKSPKEYGEERPDLLHILNQQGLFMGEKLHLKYEKLIDERHFLKTLLLLQVFFSRWAYAPFDLDFATAFQAHFNMSLREYREYGQ